MAAAGPWPTRSGTAIFTMGNNGGGGTFAAPSPITPVPVGSVAVDEDRQRHDQPQRQQYLLGRNDRQHRHFATCQQYGPGQRRTDGQRRHARPGRLQPHGRSLQGAAGTITSSTTNSSILTVNQSRDHDLQRCLQRCQYECHPYPGQRHARPGRRSTSGTIGNRANLNGSSMLQVNSAHRRHHQRQQRGPVGRFRHDHPDPATASFTRSSAASTFNGQVAGSATIEIEAGAGTLTLTGSNTYSGGTNLNARHAGGGQRHNGSALGTGTLGAQRRHAGRRPGRGHDHRPGASGRPPAHHRSGGRPVERIRHFEPPGRAEHQRQHHAGLQHELQPDQQRHLWRRPDQPGQLRP